MRLRKEPDAMQEQEVLLIAEVSDAYPAKGAGLKKERKYPT